eukprot:15442936-Alexandrium_andersonii.AAC.1
MQLRLGARALLDRHIHGQLVAGCGAIPWRLAKGRGRAQERCRCGRKRRQRSAILCVLDARFMH